MYRPLPALLVLSLMAVVAGCGRLKVVDVPEPDDDEREAPRTTARPAPETGGSAWASQLALDACRSEIARRWRISESQVRTSTRAHNSGERTDLVNWDVPAGAAGYCRVDERGVVLSVETERSPAQAPEVARQPEPTPVPHNPAPQPPAADPDDDPQPPAVAPAQLEACRSTVVRETGARPDEVGLSAGSPDERGTVLIDWSLGTGREGTCLVDSGNTVVQFRR
jgi:hypothetical protein